MQHHSIAGKQRVGVGPGPHPSAPQAVCRPPGSPCKAAISLRSLGRASNGGVRYGAGPCPMHLCNPFKYALLTMIKFSRVMEHE